jgi:hypothetical protein
MLNEIFNSMTSNTNTILFTIYQTIEMSASMKAVGANAVAFDVAAVGD